MTERSDDDGRGSDGPAEPRCADELALRDEALDALAFGLSHEVQQPMTALRLAVAGFEGADAPQVAGGVELLEAATEALGAVLREMQQLARAASARMSARQVDVTGYARLYLQELARQKPQQGLVTSVDAGLVVHGDERHLRIIVRSLLEHAWRCCAGHDGATIHVGANKGAVSIRHDGASPAPKRLGKPIGPVADAIRDGRLLGFGHGVALAAYLVHMNGGSFWFRDEPHGQTCSFVFPAEAPESEAPESDGDAGARPDALADQ